MYHINDCVVYGAAGVMKIVDITRESVGGASHEYYVLSVCREHQAPRLTYLSITKSLLAVCDTL